MLTTNVQAGTASPADDNGAAGSDVFDRIAAALERIADAVESNGQQPELLDAKRAAVLIGCGERTLRTYVQAELVPAPVRIGDGCIRWRRMELVSWAAAGCPRRADWRWEPE